MDTLIFRIILGSETGKEVQLECMDFSQITTNMWEELGGNIAREPTLISPSAEILARRAQTGYAAAAVFEYRIVCYITLAPIIHSEGNAPSWETLTAGLNLDSIVMPVSDVYTSTSSWTAPEWRKRGINMSIRKPLFDRYLAAPHLGISGMYGLASPLLAQLGWRIIGWNRVPYISSLIGIPAAEFPDQSARTWHPPQGKVRYQGEHIRLDAIHPWERYVYVWTSDTEIAQGLDEQIQTLFNGDLHRWRSVIVDNYMGPNSMWHVAFDNG